MISGNLLNEYIIIMYQFSKISVVVNERTIQETFNNS